MALEAIKAELANTNARLTELGDAAKAIVDALKNASVDPAEVAGVVDTIKTANDNLKSVTDGLKAALPVA